MADDVIMVRLQLERAREYIAELEEAAQTTDQFGDDAEQAGRKAALASRGVEMLERQLRQERRAALLATVATVGQSVATGLMTVATIVAKVATLGLAIVLTAALLPAIAAVTVAATIWIAVLLAGFAAIGAGAILMVVAVIARFKEMAGVAGSAASRLTDAGMGLWKSFQQAAAAGADKVMNGLVVAMRALAPLVRSLAPIFTKLGGITGKVLGDLGRFVAHLGPQFREMLRALGPAIPAVGSLLKALLSIFVRLGTIGAPVATKAIKVLTGWLRDLAKWLTPGRFAQAADVLRRAWGAVLPILKDLYSTFVDWLIPAGRAVIKFWQGIPGPVRQAALALAAVAAVIFGGPIVAILALVALAVVVHKNWSKLGPFFQRFWASIRTTFWSVRDALVKGWKQIVTSFATGKADLVRLWQGIKNAVMVALAAIVPIARRAFAGVMQMLRGAAAVIGGLIKVIGGILTGNWSKAWQGVKQIVRGAVNLIVGQLRVITAPVRQLGSTVGRFIGGAFRSAWGAVRSAGGSIVSFVSSMPGRIAAAASGMWSSIVTGFKSAINSVIDLWNGLSLTVGGGTIDTGILGIGKVDIPQVSIGTPDIPHLAHGGMLRRGGMVQVGERGKELLRLPAGAKVQPRTGGSASDGRMRLHPDDIAALAVAVSNLPINLDGEVVSRKVDRAREQIGARR